MEPHHRRQRRYNSALNKGGTLYIDDGLPTPGMFEETLRNLHEISPTYYANVPAGYAALRSRNGEGRRAVPKLLQEYLA